MLAVCSMNKSKSRGDLLGELHSGNAVGSLCVAAVIVFLTKAVVNVLVFFFFAFFFYNFQKNINMLTFENKTGNLFFLHIHKYIHTSVTETTI